MSDVTLKRGIIGSLGLYQWIDQIRNGNQAGLRTVVIQLQNEDHTAIVMTWKLLRARIIKHTSGPLNAKGIDVAIEEITLAYERLDRCHRHATVSRHCGFGPGGSASGSR